MKAYGTGHTKLTNTSVNGEYPAWSPDGKKIAFSSKAGDIFVMEADGTKVEQLTRTESLDHSPDWRQLP
jgi:TolB protein